MPWRRIGDFNNYHSVRSIRLPVRYVTFKNDSYWKTWPLVPTIKKIVLEEFFNKKIFCKITVSPLCRDQFLNLFKKYFSETEYSILSKNEYELTWGLDSSAKLKKLFNELNILFKRIEFTSEIMHELDQIHVSKDLFKRPKINHVIQKADYPITGFKPYKNPAKKNQTNIIKLIRQTENKKISTNELVPLVIEHLSAGEDIDQVTEVSGFGLGEVLLTTQFPEKSDKLINELMEILLFYGLNPCQTGKVRDFCVIELTIHLGKQSTLHVILGAINKVERPLKIELRESKLVAYQQEIKSSFHFTNETQIFSVIKRLNAVTTQEYKDLYQLFCEFFVDPNGNQDNLVNCFREDFKPEANKLVDLLFVQNRNAKELIGFALTKLDNIDGQLTSTALYAGITPQYRNLRFSSLLKSRQGFALQTRLEEQVIIAYYAMHIDIYGKDLGEHFPKQQTDHYRQFIPKLNAHVYGNESLFFQDQITCFVIVKNPLKVRNSYFTRPKDDLRQKIFYGYFQGYKRDCPDFLNDKEKALQLVAKTPRETPIAYPANLTNLNELKATLWKNFNLLTHCQDLSVYLFYLFDCMPSKILKTPSTRWLNYSIWSLPCNDPDSKPLLRSKL